MKHRLIVGLGNPGKKYELTRHNIGYLVVQALAHGWGWTLKEEKRFSGQVAKGSVEGVTVHLLLPTTYMNESGRSVRAYLDYYKLDVDSVVVVTDDIAIDFGQLRVRSSGGSGGHNGLKSVEAHLNTGGYSRLRMGIGEKKRGELSDHVLSSFNSEEMKELPKVIERGANIVIRLLREEITNVMNDVNRKNNKKISPKMGQES